MSEWISVDDRMPNDMEYVAVTDGYDVAMAECYKGRQFNVAGLNLDDLDTNTCFGNYFLSFDFEGPITHWMPLPESPK